MAVLRTTLTAGERDIIGKLNSKLHKLQYQDRLHDAYYEGAQRIKHMGLAVPEEQRLFELIANWPGMYVDELMRRQKVKSVYRPGSDGSTPPDKALQEGFDANNLSSEIPILCKETRIFGRCFLTVGTNEDDADHPLITLESPKQMSVLVNQRRRRIDAALRQYREENGERVGTLFLPDKTIQLVVGKGGWEIDTTGGDSEPDVHNLGKVPVIMVLNRRRLGKWTGATEMASVMPITDACARTLTNLQLAVETHAVPPRWALGVSKGDFVDRDGNMLPVWQSYYQAIWATQKGPKDAQLGQFAGSDLRNFHETVKMYAELASSVTGLPFRFFGANTANPAAEGAIRADESRIVSNVEESNEHVGTALGWTMALYEKFRTGDWPDAGLPIAVDWRNPATPTKAEEADAIQKQTGGVAVLSREGAWDDMGWDEARKARERKYFEAEAERDPLNQLARARGTTPGANPGTDVPVSANGDAAAAAGVG
ncbi:phage portal protein [Nocardia wallacei]|uniref:phage portal protein n=1 Tax=Nocardia wallacei TaxID=480035 RepID=UPI00245871D7|nr:phage portal protein [Nocardia wallacei]